jgi:hypothetical protein
MEGVTIKAPCILFFCTGIGSVLENNYLKGPAEMFPKLLA